MLWDEKNEMTPVPWLMRKAVTVFHVYWRVEFRVASPWHPTPLADGSNDRFYFFMPGKPHLIWFNSICTALFTERNAHFPLFLRTKSLYKWAPSDSILNYEEIAERIRTRNLRINLFVRVNLSWCPMLECVKFTLKSTHTVMSYPDSSINLFVLIGKGTLNSRVRFTSAALNIIRGSATIMQSAHVKCPFDTSPQSSV